MLAPMVPTSTGAKLCEPSQSSFAVKDCEVESKLGSWGAGGFGERWGLGGGWGDGEMGRWGELYITHLPRNGQVLQMVL